MSKIKFDKKDFYGSSPFWDSIIYWEVSNDPKEEQIAANRVDKAVQRLIKKYVKRERKRLARVMRDQQEIAIGGFLENLAADWGVPVKMLAGSGPVVGKVENVARDGDCVVADLKIEANGVVAELMKNGVALETREDYVRLKQEHALSELRRASTLGQKPMNWPADFPGKHLEDMKMTDKYQQMQQCYNALIEFVLQADDGFAFLGNWNEGEFGRCREYWPEAPEDCYIGADPFHPETIKD